MRFYIRGNRFVIGKRLFSQGAQVNPAHSAKLRQGVGILFMLDEDGALIAVPEHVVVVSPLPFVLLDQRAVNVFLRERLQALCAVFIGAEVAHEAACEPEPRRRDGGIGAVSHSGNHSKRLVGNLGSVDEAEPLYSLLRVHICLGEADEGIYHNVADGDKIKVSHDGIIAWPALC